MSLNQLLPPSLQAMEREFKAVTDQEKQEVVGLGGLHVIGTERHEARRVDNQLRGRSGRCAFALLASSVIGFLGFMKSSCVPLGFACLLA